MAGLLEPDWGGDPGEAIRVVADSGFWIGDRLLDLVGLFLTVAALTVVGHTFAEGRGDGGLVSASPSSSSWARSERAGLSPLRVMKDVADTWVATRRRQRSSRISPRSTLRAAATEDLIWVALLALGLYLTVLAAAILSGGVYARWIGWVSAVGAVLLLGGELLELVFEAAFVGVLAGFVLFMVVLIALGVSMWRQAAPAGQRRASQAADPHLA